MDDSPAAVDVGACSAARVSLGAVENRGTEDRTSGSISAAGSSQPVSPCPPGADTPLARDYPALAALPRDELEYLLTAPLDDNIQADQDVYLDALIHSLPEMHALYDEHRRLRGLVENAAGTARRIIRTLTQLATCSCVPSSRCSAPRRPPPTRRLPLPRRSGRSSSRTCWRPTR